MILRQIASVAGCVQSFMLVQKCRPRISEFLAKIHFSARGEEGLICFGIRYVPFLEGTFSTG